MISTNLLIGISCTMLVNILFGVTLGTLNVGFDWKKLLSGFVKAICVVAGLVLICIAGYYNPDILVININGVDLNLINAVDTIFILGITFYGYQDIDKLIKILGLSVNHQEVVKEDEVEPEVSAIFEEDIEEED